jgi:hypothetical protein
MSSIVDSPQVVNGFLQNMFYFLSILGKGANTANTDSTGVQSTLLHIHTGNLLSTEVRMTPSLLSRSFFESLTQKKLNFEGYTDWSSFYDYFSKRSGIFYLAENREK